MCRQGSEWGDVDFDGKIGDEMGTKLYIQESTKDRQTVYNDGRWRGTSYGTVIIIKTINSIRKFVIISETIPTTVKRRRCCGRGRLRWSSTRDDMNDAAKEMRWGEIITCRINWTGHWGERMQFNWKIGVLWTSGTFHRSFALWCSVQVAHMLIDQVSREYQVDGLNGWVSERDYYCSHKQKEEQRHHHWTHVEWNIILVS